MNSGENLTSKIAIGTRGHFSIGNISKKGEFWGGVYHIEVVAGWTIDKKTWMIVDFTDMKAAVSRVLNSGFEHGFVVPQESRKLAERFRKKGMNIIETPGWSLEWLPIMIFDRLRVALREPAHLRLIRLQSVPGNICQVEAGDERIKVGKIRNPKRRSSWECNLNFGHRIIGLWKCETPHSHSWKPKIRFNRELMTEEYTFITAKIEEKLKKSWQWKWVFQTSDDFWLSISSRKKHIKELSSPPTTEMIAMEMIREIEHVLRKTGTDIQLVHFELWETPTNFVTT